MDVSLLGLILRAWPLGCVSGVSLNLVPQLYPLSLVPWSWPLVRVPWSMLSSGVVSLSCVALSVFLVGCPSDYVPLGVPSIMTLWACPLVCPSKCVHWGRLLNALEIKPYWLGSRIRDMDAESHLISFLGESLVSRTVTVGWTERWVSVPKCAPRYVFGL